MHVAIALMKSGDRVATIDLDSRQKSFTNYIENRRSWAARIGRDLGVPDHVSIDADADDEAAKTLADTIDAFMRTHDYIIIDTPGHGGRLVRLAHSLADTLITPLNDSYVDFDVLGTVDAETFGVTGGSHYSQMVVEARRQRMLSAGVNADWIVLRNRLSMINTRNKRAVGESLQELSQRLDFRCIEGLAERLIFREFFPRGLTAIDDLNEGTLGTRPTMSHASARQEVEILLNAMRLAAPAAASTDMQSQNRDAA
jgi:chromosome partitioning protein